MSAPDRARGSSAAATPWAGTELDGPTLRGHAVEPLVERVRRELATRGQQATLENVAEHVRGATGVRGAEATESLARRVLAALVGFGPLQSLIESPGVTDVLVNPDGTVWVDDQAGLRRVPSVVLPASEVRKLAVRLVSLGGRRLDEAQPYADVVLAGVRVHAVLPPISDGAPALSLRRTRSTRAVLGELFHDPDDPWPPLLRHVITARLNFLISGGTGAGKTTLLSAMLAEASADERLVIVEDAHELSPAHPHALALQSRAPNTEGAGGIRMTELVREALRMRPDRLVVGECRGEEVRDVLMALNTGHDGAGATVHANSAGAVGERLVALGALGGWDARSTSLQAAAAIDVVIHVARVGGARRPVGMARLRVQPGGELSSESILDQDHAGNWRHGPAYDWFQRLRGRGA